LSAEYRFEDVELTVDKVELMVNGTVEFELEVGQKESWGHYGGDPPIADSAIDIKCTELASITSYDRNDRLIKWHKIQWYPEKEKFLKQIREAVEGIFEGHKENGNLVEHYKISEY
jgi:hypothetical protein